MSRAGSLLKNTGILFVAKAATQVISFLLLPVYTAVLSNAEYGEIDLYATGAMIILPFLTMQMEQAVFRYLVGVGENEERSAVITSGCAAILLSLGLVTIIYLPVAVALRINNAALVYFYYSTQALAAMLLQICRGFSDNVGYCIGSFLAASLAVLANILFVVFFGWGVPGALLATVASNAVAMVFLTKRTKIYKYINISSFSPLAGKKLLGYSAPLIFNQVSSWAVNYSNRVILLAFMGVGANGVYAVACKFSNILSTVYGVYNLAWTENVVLSSKDEDYQIYVSKMTTATVKGYLFLVMMVLSFLPVLFPLFVNEAFWDAYDQVPMVVIGMFFSGMAAMLGSIFIVHEKTVSVALTTCAAGIACIALNFITVPQLGLYSASGSYLVAFCMMFFYRYSRVQSLQKVCIDWIGLLPDLLFCFGLCVLYYLRLSIPCLVLGLAVAVYEGLFIKRAGLIDIVIRRNN